MLSMFSSHIFLFFIVYYSTSYCRYPFEYCVSCFILPTQYICPPSKCQHVFFPASVGSFKNTLTMLHHDRKDSNLEMEEISAEETNMTASPLQQMDGRKFIAMLPVLRASCADSKHCQIYFCGLFYHSLCITHISTDRQMLVFICADCHVTTMPSEKSPLLS